MKWHYLPLPLLLFFGCSIDDRYFDPQRVGSYQLGYTVIPQSRVEEVALSSNGETIYGIFVKSLLVANATVTSAPTILYSHGNSDNIDNYWHKIEILDPLNYNIFIYDYQGYGKSTGTPTLAGCRQNAVDALAYLKTRSDVDKTRLISYGFSLGGIFAIHLAANIENPAVLILEGVPASSNSLAESVLDFALPSSFLFDETFNNTALIPRVSAPTLFLHSSRDEDVPYENNVIDLHAASTAPKLLITVEGAKHDELPQTMGESNYRAALQNFIDDFI